MVRQCREALAARGSTIIREATGIHWATGIHEATGAGPADNGGDIVDWHHYPEGEAYDPSTHAQYFYHRHPAPARMRSAEPGEHGHFHLFLRGAGMPAGTTPLLLPELAVADASRPRQSAPLKRGGRDEVCHLVAIAVDAQGEPTRLFTTNRWVTGETWYRADDVIGMLGHLRLRMASEPPAAPLDRWIGALVSLFQPEIAALLRQRDETIIERRFRWRTNVLEDPRLEITSSLDIDLDARLAAVEAGAADPATTAGPPHPTRLPPMAEGWGA